MPLALRESVVHSANLPRNDDVLLARSALLAESDRLMVETILFRGQGTRDVARLMGISERTVRYRMHQLIRRMTSRLFLDTARALGYLPSRDRALARTRFCAGMSIPWLCAHFRLKKTQVRRRLDWIRAMVVSIRLHPPNAAWRDGDPKLDELPQAATGRMDREFAEAGE